MDSEEHLKIVGDIAAILNKIEDQDDVYFVIRTLKNIFLWDEEDSHTQWLFEKALDSFMRGSNNRDWMKNKFNLIDKQ